MSSDFVNVNGISLTNCFPFYQPLINNYTNSNSIKPMNGVKLNNISVNNSTTTYDVPGDSTIYSNGILKITDSGNSNIIFDVDTTSLQSKRSSTSKLSSDVIIGLTILNLFNGGTVNGANILYNNTIKI